MPTRREVLQVFQNAGVKPEPADNLNAASARTVACHSDRCGAGIGHEMLDPAGQPGPNDLLRGQKRQDRQEDDATPGQDPKECQEQGRAHV